MEVSDLDVIKEEIQKEVKPVPKEVAKLKELAKSNADDIMMIDLTSLDDRKTIVKSIESFGMDTMQSSSRKNAMLQVSCQNLSKIGGESGEIASSLLDLQKEVKDLDPSVIDFTKDGILGKLFNPLRAYFNKYQKADDVISDIVVSLNKGRETLKNDNTTLEIEEVAMRDLTKKLMKEIEMGSMMDEALTKQIDNAKASNEDPDKIRFVTEEIQFPLRQRIMDMQQMLVVNQQGIMAVEIVRRNNKELIRGVDRANNVTISAMRIAAMVASALYNQNIVLKKIEMLNETTNKLISGTSKMLKEQGTEIHKQSMEANISVETLKTAFTDVIAAMDEISAYKQEALPKMAQTISEFSELAKVGEEQIKRLEKGSQIDL
jgi:uncharacterized protein YaaN involved in tellurite resistance